MVFNFFNSLLFVCSVFFLRILHREHLVPAVSLAFSQNAWGHFNLLRVSRTSSRKNCKVISHSTFSLFWWSYPIWLLLFSCYPGSSSQEENIWKNNCNLGVSCLRYLASLECFKWEPWRQEPGKGKVRECCNVAPEGGDIVNGVGQEDSLTCRQSWSWPCVHIQ